MFYVSGTCFVLSMDSGFKRLQNVCESEESDEVSVVDEEELAGVSDCRSKVFEHAVFELFFFFWLNFKQIHCKNTQKL